MSFSSEKRVSFIFFRREWAAKFHLRCGNSLKNAMTHFKVEMVVFLLLSFGVQMSHEDFGPSYSDGWRNESGSHGRTGNKGGFSINN
jgi:hypothetical protein